PRPPPPPPPRGPRTPGRRPAPGRGTGCEHGRARPDRGRRPAPRRGSQRERGRARRPRTGPREGGPVVPRRSGGEGHGGAARRWGRGGADREAGRAKGRPSKVGRGPNPARPARLPSGESAWWPVRPPAVGALGLGGG